MKEVSVIEIGDKEYLVNKVIGDYNYCSNLKDLKDVCILKKVIENDEEIYVALSDQELEEAIELFN